MLDFMRKSKAKRFLMLTECGLSSRLQSEFPDKNLWEAVPCANI